MPNLTTDQIYDRQLQTVKGWPREYQLDKRLPKSGNESGVIYAGMVVHQDGAAGFRLGCTGLKMPYFAFKGENNLDSGSQVNPRGEWVMGNGPQGVTAIAAVSACELRTWAFKPNPDYTDTKDDDNVYAQVPDSPLLSADGYLAHAASTLIGATNIVGMTSGPVQGPDPRVNNRRMLPFYPVFSPARAPA